MDLSPALRAVLDQQMAEALDDVLRQAAACPGDLGEACIALSARLLGAGDAVQLANLAALLALVMHRKQGAACGTCSGQGVVPMEGIGVITCPNCTTKVN